MSQRREGGPISASPTGSVAIRYPVASPRRKQNGYVGTFAPSRASRPWKDLNMALGRLLVHVRPDVASFSNSVTEAAL